MLFFSSFWTWPPLDKTRAVGEKTWISGRLFGFYGRWPSFMVAAKPAMKASAEAEENGIGAPVARAQVSRPFAPIPAAVTYLCPSTLYLPINGKSGSHSWRYNSFIHFNYFGPHPSPPPTINVPRRSDCGRERALSNRSHPGGRRITKRSRPSRLDRIITPGRERLERHQASRPPRSPISSWWWRTTRMWNSALWSTCPKRELFSRRAALFSRILSSRRQCAARLEVRCSPVCSFTITASWPTTRIAHQVCSTLWRTLRHHSISHFYN